jgi:GNAT superfamily N-acetyltransferase
MEKRNLFFIMVGLLAFGQQQSIYGMLSKAMVPFQQELRLCSDFAGGEIRAYNAERDKKFIIPIASKHLPKLVSDVTKENHLDMLEEEVMSTLDSEFTTSKIYHMDGKAVGFIDYYINHTQPWYQRFIPYPFKPRIKLRANINFLAIADECQGKGIGKELLKYALRDCEKQSVNLVTLKTTDFDEKLKEFYIKFGFKLVRASKFTGVTSFSKLLKE